MGQRTGKRGVSGLRKVDSKRRRSLRRRVFERDGHKCVYCGSDENLTLGHIKPASKGGKNNVENLQTECYGCNYNKGCEIVPHTNGRIEREPARSKSAAAPVSEFRSVAHALPPSVAEKLRSWGERREV